MNTSSTHETLLRFTSFHLSFCVTTPGQLARNRHPRGPLWSEAPSSCGLWSFAVVLTAAVFVTIVVIVGCGIDLEAEDCTCLRTVDVLFAGVLRGSVHTDTCHGQCLSILA